jgi:hypothetical protein
MKAHADNLKKFNIMEKFEGRGGRKIERIYMGLFLVPKKTPPQGRLIGDARPLNELQRPPDDMGLPRILDVIRTVLESSHAAKADGVSYFYQILLGRKIRRFFMARLAGRRGKVQEMQFVRLPMGWKFSPFIAQQLSKCVVKGGVGVAWLDDFLILGQSKTEFHTHRETFLNRVRRYNIEIDNYVLNPETELKALGLEFDLATKQYRLDPAWVDKRKDSWEAIRNNMHTGGKTTYRSLF